MKRSLVLALLTIITVLVGCESGGDSNGGNTGGTDGETIKVGNHEVPAASFTEDQWKHQTHEVGDPCNPDPEIYVAWTCNAARDTEVACDDKGVYFIPPVIQSQCNEDTLCIFYFGDNEGCILPEDPLCGPTPMCILPNFLCTPAESGLSCMLYMNNLDDHNQYFSDCPQKILESYGYDPGTDDLIVQSTCPPTEYPDKYPGGCFIMHCDYDPAGVWFWHEEG